MMIDAFHLSAGMKNDAEFSYHNALTSLETSVLHQLYAVDILVPRASELFVERVWSGDF